MAQSSQSHPVIAQRITSTKSSPKIAAVLWTRRVDHYTLQVVFPRPSAAIAARNPPVTLWLLGADGTVIPASQNAPPKIPTSEVSYSVPLSSGQAAVAVALRVDDEFFIEKLRSLE
jgi:hypothetical protein